MLTFLILILIIITMGSLANKIIKKKRSSSYEDYKLPLGNDSKLSESLKKEYELKICELNDKLSCEIESHRQTKEKCFMLEKNIDAKDCRIKALESSLDESRADKERLSTMLLLDSLNYIYSKLYKSPNEEILSYIEEIVSCQGYKFIPYEEQTQQYYKQVPHEADEIEIDSFAIMKESDLVKAGKVYVPYK